MSKFSLHTLYHHDASNLPLRPLQLRNGSHFQSAETSGVELMPPEVGISWYRDPSVHSGIGPYQTQFVLTQPPPVSASLELYRVGTWLSLAWSRWHLGVWNLDLILISFYTRPLAKTIGFRRSQSCPGHLVRERL